MVFLLLLAVHLPLVLAAGRTSPPAGALVVNESPSSGQYSTFQAAVNALSTTSISAQSIFIEAGTYNEQVYIPARKAQLTVYGSTSNTASDLSNTVTITHSASLATESSDDNTGRISGLCKGMNVLTRMLATVRNWAANTKFYNINIANT